eukprot:TRINITY_DN9256_c0_g1_i1.p1 TRINITY_DN9256_c0_g1~~TRINITY_DN9256_c0_g1_i1.p1  ORF type:complete len:112 (-),score=16.91 TRINITY_DN9256_c0_g1_i1:103-438(-)
MVKLHAAPTSIPEINGLPEGSSVRVIARLAEYDAMAKRAVLQREGHSLEIETDLLGLFPCEVGQSITVFGEVVKRAHSSSVRVRIARSAAGLDVGLYEQALELQRSYLNGS